MLKLDCHSFNEGVIESLFDELASKKVPIVELELSNLVLDHVANGFQMIEIESLCLKSCIFYDRRLFLQLMNRMPSIKTILMNDSSSISLFDVQSLADSFVNLTTLRCKLRSNVINGEDFLGIVNSVKVRTNQTKLSLIVEKSHENILLVTKDNDIFEKNIEWLELRLEAEKSERTRPNNVFGLIHQI